MDALASLKLAWAVLIALAAALIIGCAVIVIRGSASAPIRNGSQGRVSRRLCRAARRMAKKRPSD